MKQFITNLNLGETIDIRWFDEIRQNMTDRIPLFHIYSGFADKEYLSQLMQQISNAIPNAIIVGTESGGEIAEGHMLDRCILVTCMIFNCTDIKLSIFDGIENNEKQLGRQIRKELNIAVANDIKAAELLLPGALFDTMGMYEEIKLCDPDICIFGGYAGDHSADLQNAFVMANGNFYENSVIVVMYCGKDFYIDAKKSAGWEKLGMPFKITKANGNIIQEINETPAAEIYKKYLNIDIDDADFAEKTNEFPIAAYVDGEELLRHTNQANEDGSLRLAGGVIEGWDMYLTFGNPEGIINDVNRRLEEINRFNPEVILLYSCYVRKIFWEKFVNVELNPFKELGSIAGFNTFGEILRNMNTGEILEYNITLLSIAMREGEKEPRKEEAPKANDTILSGQSSLVKRLAQLVSSSTAEIQAANEKLKYVSEHDFLTGLYNRGKTEDIMKKLLEKTQELNCKSSIVMFDIDHFKKINDTYGHRTGDAILKQIASIAVASTDPTKHEAVGRWGGEEFFITLPGYDEKSSFEFAENLRKRVESYKFFDVPKLTISLGVLTIDGSETIDEIYVHVDNALYNAKESGRNITVRL